MILSAIEISSYFNLSFFNSQVNNLQKVHTFMTDKLERSIKFDELFAESGDVVEKVSLKIIQLLS